MKVRTAHEMEEERLRTLYIRLPHTIKNIDEIRDLVFGDADIKLPRQSGRHCHVLFPSVEEKLKNMKALKKKLLDNKHIFVSTPKVKSPVVKREKKKKVKSIPAVEIPKTKEEDKITKICFLHKIPKSATVKDLKPLFPTAKSVAILFKQRLKDNFTGRTGIVKFRDVKTAGAYLRKEIPWPVCKGVQLEIHRDKRRQKNRRKKNAALKIYDGDDVKEEEIKSEPEDVPSESEEVKSESEDDDDDEEEEEAEEEEESVEEDETEEEISDGEE